MNRQPGAGRTLEVKCPMCETVGYVSPKAAGKQVKCCNPKCMVPLFAVPSLEKKEVVAPPPPPKKKIPWLYLGAGVALLAVVGVSLKFILFPPGPTQIDAPPELANYQPRANADPLTMSADSTEASATQQQKTIAAAPSVEAAQEAVVKQALARLLEVSGNIPAQRRPMWRRLAVLAYSAGGEPDKSREQLNLLEKGTNQSPWEGIPPLVSLAWQQAGAPAEFQKLIDETSGLAAKLPARGRFATEASIGVAPLLAATGKADAARQLLAQHRSDPPIEQFAAAMRVIVEDQSYDLDRTLPGRATTPWQTPVETAVTLALTAHGRWDEARSWAGQCPDLAAKVEASVVWAEAFLRETVPADDANGLERALAIGADLPPAGKILLLARLADVRLGQGNRAAAAELTGQALELLKAQTPPKSPQLDGVKSLLDLKLEDPVALRQLALAAAEVARVQMLLGDAGAWDQVSLGMRFLAASGPALTPVLDRRRQVDNELSRVSGELAKALSLKKDDDIRRAVTQYKLKLKDIENAAISRFQAELMLLQSAVQAGLQNQVWDLLQATERKSPADHQPLLTSFLPTLLVQKFAAAGDNTRAGQVHTAAESRVDPSDPEVVKLHAAHELQAGNLAGCVELLNGAITPNGHLHETVGRFACRLVNEGKLAESISFCNAIRDPSLREESLYLTAALSGRQGHGVDYWKIAKDQNLNALESCAAAAGLVVGLQSAKTGGKR